MVIKYRMETKLKDVDVYFCCDGWAHAEGSKECKRRMSLNVKLSN